MGEKISKVTIIDIARELNITAATVSRALNDHPGIKDTTRQMVKATASRLNYRHNKVASSLRLGKSNIIGVIIPSAETNFFGSVVHGIEKVANENNYNVLIYQSNELYEYEKKGVQTFLQSQVDGVLASISKETINLDHYSEIRNRGIPLILFDRTNDKLGVSTVEVDDFAGAFQATKHLIENGCRRIAHIAGQQHVNIFNLRLKGYIEALNVHGIVLDDDLISFGKVSVESGKECMKKLLVGAVMPDGVFAVEDFTALGAIQAIKTAGLRIPGDIAIIGFANEAFGEYLTPS
ncbi:MAG TPA: LacI family DNA-binding transcriptional regulator, partial [Puia sp.]|nr:LacI family DNA-binding transcriptional regulator [Puia sp.]